MAPNTYEDMLKVCFSNFESSIGESKNVAYGGAIHENYVLLGIALCIYQFSGRPGFTHVKKDYLPCVNTLSSQGFNVFTTKVGYSGDPLKHDLL